MYLLLGAFIGLMVIGVPVAVSLASASILYIVVLGGIPDLMVAQRMLEGLNSFPLLALSLIHI